MELVATLYLPGAAAPLPAPGLIVGHGAGSRRVRHDLFCREARRRGFVVLAVDFRGHGDSGGEADGPLEQDLLAVACFLRAHPVVDAAKVSYRGSSMGGFYGLKAAPSIGLAAMVLLCPASQDVMLNAIARVDAEKKASERQDAERVDQERVAASADTDVPRWNPVRLRTYFESQDTRRLASQVRCPVLVVHARADEVVPFRHSLLLMEHLRGEATMLALPGGTHTTAQHDPSVHRYSVDWLAAKLMH